MKVLLVDDDTTFSGIFATEYSDVLGDMVAVSTFDDALGAIAVDQAANREFGLAFIDYDLKSAKNGLDLIREVRTRGYTLPTVILSGYGEDLQEKCKAEKVALFEKQLPLDVRTVLSAVVLALSSVVRELEARHAIEVETGKGLSDFASTIVHETGTVVDTAIAQADTLISAYRNGSIDAAIPKIKARLQTKRREAAALEHYINEYASTGKLSLSPAIENLYDATVQALSDYMDKPAVYKNLNIDVSDTRLSAYIDQNAFKRILSILIKNALDHCVGVNKIHVRIRFREQRGPSGAIVEVDVEDNGPGVPEEIRESIFRLGDRGGKTERPKGLGGFGCGLHMARTLARYHELEGFKGDVICVSTSEGSGACFRISLPKGS